MTRDGVASSSRSKNSSSTPVRVPREQTEVDAAVDDRGAQRRASADVRGDSHDCLDFAVASDAELTGVIADCCIRPDRVALT